MILSNLSIYAILRLEPEYHAKPGTGLLPFLKVFSDIVQYSDLGKYQKLYPRECVVISGKFISTISTRSGLL